MRSISAQSFAQLGGGGSVLSRQKRDHIRLDALLQRLQEVPAANQDKVLLDIYRLVFPHAFAEEAVLWPVMRRVLPDGDALTLQVELEHQRINELVTRLETLEPGTPPFQRVLTRVIELLREDVRDEEDALLPRLQEKLTRFQLRSLGLAWELVRVIAPTRPHPLVSRRPPGNVLSALPLALIDRCRDFIDSGRHARRGALASALESVSAALARGAHAVERLPGLQRGEHPATHVASRKGGGVGRAMFVAAGLSAVALAIAYSRKRRGPAGRKAGFGWRNSAT